MDEVKFYMNEDLVTVDAEVSVKETAEHMRENGVGLVVIDKKGEYVGVVTERDIVYKVVAENINPEKIKVKQIMACPIISIDAQVSMKKALKEMRQKNTRHIAVKEKGKFVGMVSMKDLVTYFMNKE